MVPHRVIYNNVKRLSELNSEGPALSEISRQYPERLTEGMSGPGVQLLQYFLAIVGEFYDALPRWQAGQLDGVFGPQTREAVTAYQQLVGLPMTGAVDRETWYALLSTYQSVLLSQPEQEWLGSSSACRKPFSSRGCAAKPCGQAQQLINIIARGYAEVPAVAEDGFRGCDRIVSRQHPVAARPARHGRHRPADMGGHGRSCRKRAGRQPECCGTVPRLSRWRGGNVIVHRCTKTQPYFRFTDLSAAHPAV